MFTDIDSELYPDDCEVVAIPPHGFFYLIQKNGSSSLRKHAATHDHTILRNDEIRDLESITVVLRPARQRYHSGVSTFVAHLRRDNPDLDLHTCQWMANKYRFLNRHYLPQFLWLVNLSRWTSKSCQLHLRDISCIDQITTKRVNVSDLLHDDHETDPAMEFWFFVDQILTDNLDKTFTWSQLLALYRQHPNQPLTQMTTRAEHLLNALHQT